MFFLGVFYLLNLRSTLFLAKIAATYFFERVNEMDMFIEIEQLTLDL
jgi:hypothetical protein